MLYTFLTSPIGKLRLRAVDSGLTAVEHTNQQECIKDEWTEDPHGTHPVLQQAVEELEQYFEGKRTTFSTPLAPLTDLGTPFQQSVWTALKTIPYGQTVSYADIANKIQNPKAVRAVGAANGKNPLSIFIPCHRVIGSNTKLTGYAGGLNRKEFLLKLEGGINSADLFD